MCRWQVEAVDAPLEAKGDSSQFLAWLLQSKGDYLMCGAFVTAPLIGARNHFQARVCGRENQSLEVFSH